MASEPAFRLRAIGVGVSAAGLGRHHALRRGFREALRAGHLRAGLLPPLSSSCAPKLGPGLQRPGEPAHGPFCVPIAFVVRFVLVGGVQPSDPGLSPCFRTWAFLLDYGSEFIGA